MLYKWVLSQALKFANHHSGLVSRDLIFAVKDTVLSTITKSLAYTDWWTF